MKNVEEERSQLHVIERVGVACRKLEHPESGCKADSYSLVSVGPAAHYAACVGWMSEWQKGKREREGNHMGCDRGKHTVALWEEGYQVVVWFKAESMKLNAAMKKSCIFIISCVLGKKHFWFFYGSWFLFWGGHLFCHYLVFSAPTNNGHCSVTDQPLLWPLLSFSFEASEVLPTHHRGCEGHELRYTPSVVCQDFVCVWIWTEWHCWAPVPVVPQYCTWPILSH